MDDVCRWLHWAGWCLSLYLMLLDTQITTKLCLLMPWFLFVYGLDGRVIVLLVLIVLMVPSPNKLESALVGAAESEFCLDVLYVIRWLISSYSALKIRKCYHIVLFVCIIISSSNTNWNTPWFDAMIQCMRLKIRRWGSADVCCMGAGIIVQRFAEKEVVSYHIVLAYSYHRGTRTGICPGLMPMIQCMRLQIRSWGSADVWYQMQP